MPKCPFESTFQNTTPILSKWKINFTAPPAFSFFWSLISPKSEPFWWIYRKQFTALNMTVVYWSSDSWPITQEDSLFGLWEPKVIARLQNLALDKKKLVFHSRIGSSGRIRWWREVSGWQLTTLPSQNSCDGNSALSFLCMVLRFSSNS